MSSRPEDFRRADALFDAALDQPPQERAAFIERTAGGDAALRAAVERLLLAHDRSERFLNESAAEIAAPLLGVADAGADEAAVPTPERVGPYRLLRELGRGGMGTVYLAERDDDHHFRQRVALKLVRGSLAAGWMVERFRAERRILASLEHPNIGRLYDGGTAADGTPYFAMEYIEGEPLDRYCLARELPLEHRLRLFRDVCAAVRYAHEQGVIHRDIKPSNILVTEAGDVKLLDFGIAKLLDAGADGAPPRTGTGVHLLTPEYAAPEQVRGGSLTRAADVYSLGMVLYELVVGERAYRTTGLTPGEVEQLVCETEPLRPSVVARRTRKGTRVGGDLDTIILKALQKDPDRRYASAGDLLDDLVRHAESRPVLARPDSFFYRARKFVGRHRLGAVVAALLVAIVPLSAIAISDLRTADDRREPSLLAAGALHARDRVVVADFSNLAGDSLLAAGITDALRVDVSQSPLVRVLSARQVADALERIQRPRDAALTDELAREVALREGAKAIVSGSIANVGGTFTVTVRLESAEQGDVLAAFRETAADSSELLAAADRASKQLRHRIGESLASLRDLPPLAQEVTGSLAALRVYTEARRLSLIGRRPEAIRRFQDAIAIDTAFAGAYVSLSMAYESIAEPGRALDASRHAVAYRHRLPFVDRSILVGSYSYGRRDYQTAIDTYTRLLEQYPHDIRALNNLALIYQDTRRFAAAESLFTRATTVDSGIANLYFGIHDTQVLQGKFAESRRTLDFIARRFPNNPILLNVEIQDAAAKQHWEVAARQAEKTIAAARGDTLALIDPYEALASIRMTQGRLREAERDWRTQLALSAAADSRGRHLYGLIQLARIELTYWHSPTRALALVDSALRATPLERVLPGDRPYDDLARFYASAGRPARARELLAAAETNDSILARITGPDRAWTRGVIALAEGQTAVAESELRRAADSLACPICSLPDLARAYAAARKPDSAAAVYERYLTTPWLFRYEADASELGWAMKRLAELDDARGNSAKAGAVRAQLVELWRRADPELQPVLADARGR